MKSIYIGLMATILFGCSDSNETTSPNIDGSSIILNGTYEYSNYPDEVITSFSNDTVFSQTYGYGCIINESKGVYSIEDSLYTIEFLYSKVKGYQPADSSSYCNGEIKNIEDFEGTIATIAIEIPEPDLGYQIEKSSIHYKSNESGETTSDTVRTIQEYIKK